MVVRVVTSEHHLYNNVDRNMIRTTIEEVVYQYNWSVNSWRQLLQREHEIGTLMTNIDQKFIEPNVIILDSFAETHLIDNV